MSILVWAIVGIAIWHFTVLLPDRFYGGIIGAFVAALGGALLGGFMLPARGVPDANPPGVQEALWPIPGAILALGFAYAFGAWRDRTERWP